MICAVLMLFLGSGSALSAQTLVKIDSGRAFVYMPPRTVMATTFCSPISKDSVAVVSVINMAYLGDSAVLEGVKVHEAVHRDDMIANHALCRPNPQQMLWMETRAYCSEAHLLTRYGMNSDSLYWSEGDKLQRQFKATLKWEQITGAWWSECGEMLELGKKK